MTKRLATSLAAVLCVACGVKLAPPPALFPVTNVWKASVGATIEPPLASDGTRLFVAGRDGSVVALSLSDGKELWRIRGKGRVSATADVVVLREDSGRLRRLDPATGADLWRAMTGIEGTLPAAIDGDTVFVAGQGLGAFSTDRGEKRWSGSDAISAPPVASGPWLFTSEEDGSVRGRERASGTPRWAFATTGAVRAPVFVDAGQNRLLVGTTDGRLLGLRLDKGTARWRWKIGADVQDAGAAFEENALFVSYDNILYAVGRGNGHLHWRGSLPSRPLSGPILTGSAVLVACQENDILGFDARTGARLGALQTPAEIRTPPLVVGNQLYVGLRDRTVVALALNQAAYVAPTPAPAASPAARPQPPKP